MMYRTLYIGKTQLMCSPKTSFVLQVFTVPLEERRFKEINEHSFGDESQTEQAKICKEIMAKNSKCRTE